VASNFWDTLYVVVPFFLELCPDKLFLLYNILLSKYTHPRKNLDISDDSYASLKGNLIFKQLFVRIWPLSIYLFIYFY